MATARNEDLRTLAQRVADALPAELAEEVVLTGSVSRGMADDVSDIEMLVVTREPLELEDCFRLARAAGLDELGTWGAQGGPTRRVSGYRERVPLELIWWPRDYAEEQIEALLAGAMHSTADALAHGIPLRTSGRLAAWQERLCAYPPKLAAAQIEDAALPWGGFTPAGLLTLIRPGDRLALTEWILDGAIRRGLKVRSGKYRHHLTKLGEAEACSAMRPTDTVWRFLQAPWRWLFKPWRVRPIPAGATIHSSVEIRMAKGDPNYHPPLPDDFRIDDEPWSGPPPASEV